MGTTRRAYSDIERCRRLRHLHAGEQCGIAGVDSEIVLPAPPPEMLDDAELLRERIGTTVTSLLGLIGLQADPIKSREHILLSSILDSAWRAGEIWIWRR